MQNWRGSGYKKLPKESLEKFEAQPFDCEKYIELNEKERRNLLQLRVFDHFKWVVEKRRFNLGHIFGESALLAAKPETALRETTVKTSTKTGLAVLSREDFFRALRKVKARRVLDLNQFISKLPFFDDLRPKHKAALAK